MSNQRRNNTINPNVVQHTPGGAIEVGFITTRPTICRITPAEHQVIRTLGMFQEEKGIRTNVSGIKFLRNQHNLSLYDAKNFVEQIMNDVTRSW